MLADKVKGIAVIVWPDEDMPVDALGNRADVIVDPTAVTKRTIAGRTLHSFIAGAMRDIRVREGIALGLPMGTSPEICMQWVENNPKPTKDLFDRIMNVRKELTPDAYRAVMEDGYAKKVYEREMERTKNQRKMKISFLNTPMPAPRIYSVMEVEVLDFLINGMNIETPPDNEIPLYTVAKKIKELFPPQYGPVKYRVNGREFTSERPVMIGSLYQLLLDKTGLENAAVASGKVSHFGIPAKLTHSERRAMPVRQQPTRSQGEAEVHNEIAAAGSKFTYELLEASNSPHAHRNICQSIFDADEPTKLKKVVGARTANDPISRPLEVVRHILECGGHTLVRDDLPNGNFNNSPSE
jgi:hypothetical protein